MAEVTEKEKILHFTHAKFITEGFYKTSMDEIAKDLHMSKKTIYKHFVSKEVLLVEVCDLRIDLLLRKLNEIGESADDSVTKFLKILNMNKIMMLNCSIAWFRDLKIHAPNCLQKFNEVRSVQVMGILKKLLEQGRREKLIESYPHDILITALNGAIEAVTHPDFILNSSYSFHDAVRITSEIFFKGFLTPLGKKKYSKTKKFFENAIS